jgi:rhamnopyranosyl-N-acetylglucosaminyl-diphospho-decaprenol beta-1,3/1,4-galactofuranosyltransferase
MNRPEELRALLGSIATQTRRPDLSIVIDNGGGADTAAVLAGQSGVRHVVSHTNLGGAGGFALGISLALAEGATQVWLMDDDGLPGDSRCLEHLLATSDGQDADLVSPIIVDFNDSSVLAFPYFLGLKRLSRTSEVTSLPQIENFAHLFNGALVRGRAFARFGMPDYRLFIRGDEVDFLHRVRRGGGRIITLTHCTFRHPSGAPETVPLMGGRLHAVVPNTELKKFYFFRNRGYLLRQHRLVKQALSDLVRYPLYFLVTQNGDWRGLSRWVKATLRGMRHDFSPFEGTPALDASTKPERRPVEATKPAPTIGSPRS